MIDKLKDFWSIFKNSRNEFYKERHEAIELIKRVKYLNSLTFKVLEKNEEILNYLKMNSSDYPKHMHSCINDLVSLFEYGSNSKSVHVPKKTSNFIYVLIDVNSKCLKSYSYMNTRFKQRRFKEVKEEYVKLINDLRNYERRYDMVILDDFFNYDEI